jgi:16S rRNA (guanine(527)-N(7))-methyltransferase RsmG
MNIAIYDKLVRSGMIDLLVHDGFTLDAGKAERMAAFLAMVREWNDFASLVSAHDAAENLEAHVVDSLSLAPCLQRGGQVEGSLFDIGSGGGFPAIPLAVLCDGLNVTLLERTTHKVGFLSRTVGALGLAGRARVVNGSFPEVGDMAAADWVTARAVEKQDRLHKAIAKRLGPKTTFLCQAEPAAVFRSGGFDISEVQDEWTARGFRRGKVYRVMRSTNP